MGLGRETQIPVDNIGEGMKIQIITPFDMQWVDGYEKVFEDHEVNVVVTPVRDPNADVMIFMCMDLILIKITMQM